MHRPFKRYLTGSADNGYGHGALADQIQALRDQVLADLNAAYDYHADTKIAWDLVDEYVAAGKTFAVKHMATGTETTQADIAAKVQGYVAGRLTEATFQQFISIFEHFFFELLRLWLQSFPQNLLGKKVDFKDVLDFAGQGRDHPARGQKGAE